MNRLIYTALITSVVVGVSLANIRKAEGKLVYENELKTQTVSSPESVVVQYQEPQVQRVQPVVVQSAPVVQQQVPVVMEAQEVTAAPQTERMTKAEAMRRSRMREELKNEDLLTQKLEELRLQDEMKRTGQILGSGIEKQPEVQMQEQRVGMAAQEVQLTPVQPMTAAPVVGQSTAMAVVSPVEDKKELSRVSVTPRGGMSGITNSMYDIESKYSLGFGVGVDISDYISFQGGYTYSTYSLAAGSSIYNPYAYSLQTLEMNDNVFDLGIRANFLPPKAKMRPFIGAGIGYRRGYVNYDDQTLSMMKAYNPYGTQNQDVELSAFMGYIETGLEFRVSDSIALSGMVRYFNILSSRQTNPLNPYGFVNPSGYGSGYGYGYGYGYGAMNGYGYNNDAKTNAGRSLADNNFYQLMLGLSVSF